MGAGLSMASVNKIKELANSREYSLALELVEHQDLSLIHISEPTRH